MVVVEALSEKVVLAEEQEQPLDVEVEVVAEAAVVVVVVGNAVVAATAADPSS